MKEEFMSLALEEAKKAYKKGEVPIGAVVVRDGKVLSKAHNRREHARRATYHAEILAIDKACKKLKDWRLEGCEIYVTLEPCPMCAGAIVNARIKKCTFGASDNSSSQGLTEKIFSDLRLNHKTELEGGVLEKECACLLTSFFKDKRKS